MKLVVHPAVGQNRLAAILSAAESIEVVNAADEAQALSAVADADAFYGRITPPLLAAAKRLRWVQAPTASMEHYLFPALVEHPVALTNMRGLYSDVIADHVLGYVLCFARNLHFYLRNQIEARWEARGGEQNRPSHTGGVAEVSPLDRAHMHLADKTLGIVGLGHIGREVARRARAFGMQVMAVDPRETESPPEVAWLAGVESLDDLLAEADFVVICAPHTPQTEKMFRRPRFERMKREAYLINIGRGAIVDLADLHQALVDNTIAGAALDVFEIEPLPTEHPLWRMENVILTPHVAACSPRIADRHFDLLLDNLRRFTSGEPLRHIVDKTAWF